MKTKEITILLADDHGLIRAAFRAMMESEPDFSVLADVDNGLDALQLVETLKPDVLVTDFKMHGLNGIDAVREMRTLSPETRIIIVSLYEEEMDIQRALLYGAHGYVLKGGQAGEMVQAVRQVMRGWRYLSPQLNERAIDAYIREVKLDEMYEQLTLQERKVLQLVGEGYTYREVARILCVQPSTIKTHAKHIRHKLGLASQTDMEAYIRALGVIPNARQCP